MTDLVQLPASRFVLLRCDPLETSKDALVDALSFAVDDERPALADAGLEELDLALARESLGREAGLCGFARVR